MGLPSARRRKASTRLRKGRRREANSLCECGGKLVVFTEAVDVTTCLFISLCDRVKRSVVLLRWRYTLAFLECIAAHTGFTGLLSDRNGQAAWRAVRL